MSAKNKNLSYVAGGFKEDCLKLIQKFVNTNDVRFEDFCKIWKEMKFSLVFVSRQSYAEMMEFCEEALEISKQLALQNGLFGEQIAGLYLLYGIYYKIPIENIKIRATLKEWKSILEFHTQLKHAGHYDGSYILTKLITDNAFTHCLFNSEFAMEKQFKMNRHDGQQNPYSVLPNIKDVMEDGQFIEVEHLCRMYTEKKNKIFGDATSRTSLKMFDDNFVDDVLKEVKHLDVKQKVSDGYSINSGTFIPLEKTIAKQYQKSNKIRPKVGHGFDTDSSDEEEEMHRPEICRLDLQENFEDYEDEEELNSD